MTVDTRRCAVAKSPTGIRGLDDITRGGLPTGRPTLVCGSAGCGKTVLGMEFLVHGAVDYGEPGVFMSFEETLEDLAENFASLGYDLRALIAAEQLIVDRVWIERHEIEEVGAYDLEGLFIRLGYAIDKIGAKRVVLDTIEVLFSALGDQAVVRSELRRLFGWLKEKGVTAIITGERGDAALTRYGVEEYVSDCVISLSHVASGQIVTRRLRVVKYRGSVHGMDEYPFLIDEQGICVLPVTSAGLNHQVSDERISSGIPRLDAMLGGQGYFRGSSILVSGTVGCGKTSIASNFADAACHRGERCLTFLFEESPSQLMRNMRSIGLDLAPWVKSGLLRFHPARPSLFGLESHLSIMLKTIQDFRPDVVIVDPISAFSGNGSLFDIRAMLIRLIDHLKTEGITALLVNLTNGGGPLNQTDTEISSLIDTWLILRDIELNGERNRGLSVVKSRGMPHSNQIREFVLSAEGVELTDVYIGPGGVLAGTARRAQEAKEHADRVAAQWDLERQQALLDRKRQVMEVQIAALQAEVLANEAEAGRLSEGAKQRAANSVDERRTMAVSRSADAIASEPPDIGQTSEGVAL